MLFVPSTRHRVVVTLLAAALIVAPLSSAYADDDPSESSIAGTVTSAGTALDDVSVMAYDATGEEVARTRTGRTGSYALTVPDNASYRLGFVDDERQLFSSEYWNDKPTLAAATPIAVGTTDTTGKDADLTRRPQIRGTVTDENLDEIEGAQITVYSLQAGEYVRQDQSNPFSSGVDGRYRVPVEPGGTYKLKFESRDHRTEWLGDAATEAEATALPVTSTVTGKDVTMTTLPAITGVVSGPAGPVQFGSVVAYKYENQFHAPEVRRVSTRPDGSYTLRLEPGEYRIGFQGGDKLATEYYDNSPTLVGSTPVTLTSGGRVLDAALEVEPTLHGTVRNDHGGAPAAGVPVALFVKSKLTDGPAWWLETATTTGSDGTYSFSVPAGQYKLSFGGGPEYVTEYYDDVATVEQASVVDLGAAGTTVDASVGRNPAVNGVVTADGDELSDIEVSLVTFQFEQWRTVATTRTATDGSYSIAAPPGTYILRFRDDKSGRFRTEYLGDSPTKAGAQEIDLSANVDGADADLVEQTAVSGSVTGPDGVPVAGVKVVAIASGDSDVDGNEVRISTTTSSSGDYRLALEDGSYRLRFEPSTLALRPEYWQNASSFADSTELVVDGGMTGDVDAELAEGSGVTGTVSAPAGSERPFVSIYKRDTDGAWHFFEEATPTTGVFDVSLPPGTYRVKYEVGSFAPIYYGGGATFGAAADVVVTPGDVQSLGGVSFGGAGAVTNVVPPVVTGAAAVGDVLKASDGQWGPSEGAVQLSRQWLRDGEPIAGATGPSYSVARADEGARIAVQVKGVQEGLLSRTKTSAPTAPVALPPPAPAPAPPAAVVKVDPSIKVSAKAGKKKATLTITVKASRVTPTGKVTIKLGRKTLKTVTLKRGKASVTLNKMKKGKRVFTIVYSGDSRVLGKTVQAKKLSIK
jgi:5-hydroxyisourate hydrolase-like protein (transthyretin family)